MKLNVGCGHYHMDGWINCDLVKADDVDMVFDCTQRWPFPDGSVEEVLMSHILEHLPKWEDAIKEVARVLMPGGTLTIRVPYGLDCTAYHVRFFQKKTLDPFFKDGHSFVLERFEINHSIPFAWHLKYKLGMLSIPWFYDRQSRGNNPDIKLMPFGKPTELIWVLVKPDRTDHEQRLFEQSNWAGI
jgi:SAM-dependent methyltransferase